jgi:hypothetical protein
MPVAAAVVALALELEDLGVLVAVATEAMVNMEPLRLVELTA